MALPARPALDSALASLSLAGFTPRVGVVLGSGLGGFAERIESARSIPYASIAHMPLPLVAGHAGALHLGTLAGVPVACLQGRVHAYEGHPSTAVCFGVSLLAAMGCRAVLLSNAAGGIDPTFEPGDFMLLVDHLNLTGTNPLLGPPDPRTARFVDLTEAYDRGLGTLARQAAAEVSVALREGVYAAMLGPSYETPAEIRMLRALGASAVGMSTVHEVIALNALGVKTAAVSCITNLAAGSSDTPLSHAEVEATAVRVREPFARFFERWIALVGSD